jgi:hypothetical protein
VKYIALSRGNTTAKFVRDILAFYGNGKPYYYLFTDNQAAENIATQPNMNEHSRSIDIRHHAIRQDYIAGEMRIEGVYTQDNTSDILTKNLQPPLHVKHTRELNTTQETGLTLSNNVVHCLDFLHETTKMYRARNPERNNPPPPRTIIPRSQPAHRHNQQNTQRKWIFDPKNYQPTPKSPELHVPTQRGPNIGPRQPDRDRQNPSRTPIRRSRSIRQNHLPPYQPPATMAHKPKKTSKTHPKTEGLVNLTYETMSTAKKVEDAEKFSGKKDGITFEKLDEKVLSW